MIAPRQAALAALLACSALLLDAGTGTAAPTPAPAWSLQSVAVPTNFVPGDEAGDYFYELAVANIGAASTNGGPIVISDTLPAGLTVKRVELPLPVSFGSGSFDYGPTACATEKAGEVETVRCTVSEELPEAIEPALVGPSEELRVIIYVSTPAGASGALSNLARVEGGGAGVTMAGSQNEASSEPAAAGLSNFSATLTGPDGKAVTQAGAHPYQYTTSFAVNTQAGPVGGAPFEPAGGNIKNIRVALPAGLVGNPTNVSLCTAKQFNTSHTVEPEPGTGAFAQNECPDGSAVGLVVVQQEEGIGGVFPIPIYNLVPPKGMPAQFGFQVFGANIFIDTALRTGGDYGVTAFVRNSTEVKRVTAASVTLWGVPAAESHDPLRGGCLNENNSPHLGFSFGSCPAGIPPQPFLRLPTSCASALGTQFTFDSWTAPGAFVPPATSSAPPPGGCAALDFDPSITSLPQTAAADSPSGLSFDLHLPQDEGTEGLGEADLRDAVVMLPEGLSVNPSSAAGLGACSPAQIELNGAQPATCPDASKIGSVEVDTPLLDHPVNGAVYVASQGLNPFGSLLAIYIAAADPQSGIVLKLAGRVDLDTATGRITTSFSDNPQLPFEDLRVHLFEGPRAPLRTPSTCGTYMTTTDLRPWSAPESGPDATPSSSFEISHGPGGQPCPSGSFDPRLSAGTTNPVAGQYSPFILRVSRDDGMQELRSLDVSLPKGLLAKLAGIPYCPEGALAAIPSAEGTGAAEASAPSCPPASQVGTVSVGAGAGPSPLFVDTGRAYLAGPYKGAPLSLVIVTPAIAGPFDLGNVVVRTALRVNSESAQVTALSDPLPTILAGIPLDIRDVRVSLGRDEFTLNPTSCEPRSFSGSASTPSGTSAPLADRFQVGSCERLAFKPKLSLEVKGATKRAGYPALTAKLKMRKGEANIGKVAVTLPHSEFLAQNHIKTICTRVQFAADECPPQSVYGFAEAKTPLLDRPLKGPVYLRANGGERELPDLVAALNGQIDIDLIGYIDSVHARIRTRFQQIPDAPVRSFTLKMKGGRKGLLSNSRNLCGAANRATVKMTGQNAKLRAIDPAVKNPCRGRKRR
jgi:hypothetical protein